MCSLFWVFYSKGSMRPYMRPLRVLREAHTEYNALLGCSKSHAQTQFTAFHILLTRRAMLDGLPFSKVAVYSISSSIGKDGSDVAMVRLFYYIKLDTNSYLAI